MVGVSDWRDTPLWIRSLAEKWEILSTQSTSDKIITEFCRKIGISVSCFHKLKLISLKFI